ncbi:MAG: hypothetical protein WB502_08935 [Thermoactinomyces sp.]
MEKKEPLVIRFPSRIPSVYMVPFPPGQNCLIDSPSKALSIIARQASDNRICLVNPPESVLDRVEKTRDITLFFDRLPKRERCSLLSSCPVIVPSLGFYYFFRQRGINAKLANLLSSLEIGRTKKMKKTEQKICLWIDERLVAPRYQAETAQIVCSLLKKQSGLDVIWVSEKRRHFSCEGVRFLGTDDADREEIWKNADVILTLGSACQSFVPLHMQLLSKGVAILTDDRGDHGEWVNHLFNGIILDSKETCKELKRALLRLLKDPGLLERFHHNGPFLLERMLRTGYGISTGQFNHSSS